MSKDKKIYLSLSVHNLVDFLLRQGDIDNRIYNQDTMQLGSKIHASFQAKQGRDYLSEVPLKEVFTRKLGVITLEGRADGIIVGGDFPIIDEIKSTVEPLEKFYEEQKEWHYGQACAYALMYLHQEKLSKAAVRLTYLSQVDSSQKMVKETIFTVEELEKKIGDLLDRYLAFYEKEFAHQEALRLGVKSLSFPFPSFRPGQRKMAGYIYRVASKGGYFFCEAPTGIGKTMSALFPALKSLEVSPNEKIFYLTAKNSGQLSAYNAISMLTKQGLEIRDSSLRSKEKMCLSPGSSCNPDDCPFAKDYYAKLRTVSELVMAGENRLSPEFVLTLAKKYAMCPFELQLDLSLFSDVIICDYNYLFDPLVKLERYFDETVDSSHYLALIDEAHNLVPRAQDMYSATLSSYECSLARRSLAHFKAPALKNSLRKLLVFLEGEKGKVNETKDYDCFPSLLTKALESFLKAHRDYSKKDHAHLPEVYRDFSRECYRYYYLSQNYFAHSIIYGYTSPTSYTLHLLCLDPSEYLKKSLDALKGAAFFSGTLSPISFYMNALLGEEQDPALLLPSPFPKENFSLIVAPMVSTRYKDRGKTYEEVAGYLDSFLKGKVGNYFFYFPSYEYLQNIKPYLHFDDCLVFSQEREMNENDRALFLSHFKSHPSKSVVGLLIIGGSFSEGIDLVGDRLCGVAVVGIGLPTISYERNKLKDYYEEKNGQGYEYAYMDPGINKVMQAVGRLIRSESDKGSALLIDDRYLETRYREIFSRLWTNYQVATSKDDVTTILEDFYKKAAS